MPYREPGVYTELINARPNTGYTPAMVPLIIAEGPAFFDFEALKMTRSSLSVTSPAGAADAIVTASNDDTAGALTESTSYSFKVTYVNEAGETLPSTASTFTTGAGKTSVRFVLKAGVALPATAVAANIYFGTSSANVKLAGQVTTDTPLVVSAVPDAAVPPVVNSTPLNDVLPVGTVTSIGRIYVLTNGEEVVIPATGNYTLTAPNIITWTDGGANVPAGGSVYYVDAEARPKTTQYEKTFVTSYEELETAYGGMFMKTTSGGPVSTLNPAFLGGYLALEAGAPGAYILQVEPETFTGDDAYRVDIATDILKTLEKASFIEDAYFLVPMTSDSTAVGACITHCNTMSTVLERKERVCFVNTNIADPAATSGIFSTQELDAVVAEVTSINDKRVRVPFITKAKKVLSDGATYSLPAEYVCAALAGLASFIPVHRSLTRQKMFCFTELLHVTNLSRANKNKLAEAGLMILEQPGGVGSAISIRHGLTTKMDNVADREHSIVVVADFTAKFVRRSLNGYIGVYNIDSFLTTKVQGTLTAVRNTLVRAGNIIDLKIGSIKQDTDNPDTLLIELSLLPPYPCNYIDIKIIVE